MSARVSVLLPVHDAAGSIDSCLESLARQTFQAFDVVLVDDGCADATVARATAAWPDARRLRVLAPGRVGLVAALQAGLAACEAPVVARMDADDLSHPERLARQAAFLDAHPEVDVLGTRVRTFADGGVGEGYRAFDAWQNDLLSHDAIVREMFVESPLSHPSVAFRAERVRALGGYRDVGWAEDYDLWHRAREAGLGFAKLPEVLLEGRDGPGRTSRTDPRYGPAAMWRCKAHHLARGPLRGRASVVVWGAGRDGRRLARALEGEGVRVAAFVDVDPRKVGGLRRGAPVVAASALPEWRHGFLLAAVGVPRARREIRAEAERSGWREGVDFLCVA